MFDYKKVLVPAKEFQIAAEEIIRTHTKDGWRLLQILQPPTLLRSRICLFGIPLFSINPPGDSVDCPFTLILERSA